MVDKLVLMLLLLFPSNFMIFAPVFLSRLVLVLNSLRFNKFIIIGFMSYITFGLLLQFINVIKFGKLYAFNFWVLGPIFWFFLISHYSSISNRGEVVFSSIKITTYVVVILNISYVIGFLSGLVGNIDCCLFKAYFGIDQTGFFAFSTSLLPIVAFLLPFWAVIIVHKYSSESLVLFIMLAFVSVLSLRMALVLSLLLSLLYLYFKLLYSKPSFYFFVAIIGVSVFLLVPQPIWDGIFSLKLEAKIGGDDPRFMQAITWLVSFSESPFFGHGLSSTTVQLFDMISGDLVFSNIGVVENPYGYEIFYLKLLSEIGLLILFPFMFYYLFSFYPVVKSHNDLVQALRFGAIVFLIQSATNSYMGTTGWLWVLMLPMIFLVKRSYFDSYNHNSR
ncbi:MAG: hypothetical protein IE909_16030 [Campylobacterales bacterium]|nr:hypothetical protein [Campylobacterales bacterium]